MFEKKITELEASIRVHELSILRLWSKWSGEPLPADPFARKALIAEIMKATGAIESSEKNRGADGNVPDALDLLKDARTRSYPAGAPPACTAISGVLFKIELRAGSESLGAALVQPGWPAEQDGLVREVLGAAYIGASEQHSLAQFITRIAEADRWAARQEVRCRFRLFADNEKNDMYSVALYKRQMKALRALFYVSTP